MAGAEPVTLTVGGKAEVIAVNMATAGSVITMVTAGAKAEVTVGAKAEVTTIGTELG